MPAVQAKAPRIGVAGARHGAGLTQEQLAQRADTTRSTIVRIEGGEQSPTAEVALAIAAAVGASVEALCGGEG